jgi:two-component system, OmpR family, response regulator
VSEPIGRVVVIEDEPPIRDAVVAALRAERFVAIGFDDVPNTGDLLAAVPDLAIVDVMLPSGNGFELARSLYRHHELPIIFLTARDAVADRVAGLELGADDYLVKPFALEELMARVRAVLRRRGAIPQILEVERLLIDEERGFATRGGRDLELTGTELRLLAFLVRHRGQSLSKEQLLTQVWGYDAYDHNLVEVHVSALRRKLEAAGPRLIHTVRGIGYRLIP